MKREYYLKWKGAESGPYSKAEIDAMLASGRAGLLHKIRRAGGSWTLLKDFDFDSQDGESCAHTDSKKCGIAGGQAFQYFLYGLSGASFLSFYIYAVVVAFCALFFVLKDTKSAVKFFAISSVSLLCGKVFFQLIYPVLAA